LSEANPRLRPQILIYRFGQIGDTVAAVPALWALRRQFPDAQLVLLSEVPARQNHLPPEAILPKKGLIDGFEKYPPGSSAKSILAAWRRIRRLRQQGFRTVVYLVPTERSWQRRRRDLLFFRLAGVRQIMAANGFSPDREPRRPDGTLIRQPREADALLARLALDGVNVPAAGEGCMDLAITDEERERARTWWHQQRRPPMPGGWVAVCPGAKVSSKLWPLERYADVVELLIRNRGVVPVIVGGPEDRETGHKLLAGWKTGLCAAGELTVRESAALMADARFYLGNDTGAMHLAAAMGVPCVALFSARDWPGKWEPYGAGHRVHRFAVPCAGCKLAVCDKGLVCLRSISVEAVYDSCVAVLAARAPQTGGQEVVP
jgi:heptosyltransferase-3